MTIQNKWKLFALRHVLSDYTGDGIALFNKLAAAEYGECDGIFEDYAVIEWQPLEYMSPDDISDLIVSMATQAQETEVTA